MFVFRESVAAQSSVVKASDKCSQGEAAFHGAATDMFILVWCNQINVLYYNGVIRSLELIHQSLL